MTYLGILLKSLFNLLLILCLMQIIFAQKSPTIIYIETLADAESKTNAKAWNEAVPLWEKVVQANPVQGRYWGRLGAAYYNAKDYRKSISAYEKQIELGFGIVADAAYNIATSYALLNEKEQSFKWLEKAFQMGFQNTQLAQTSPEFQLLRDDIRYQKLVALVDTSKLSREEGWRYDLQLLSREIKRRGYYLFPRISTEAEFDAEVQQLSNEIPKLTDPQIIVGFMKLMKRVGDGHSELVIGNRPELLQTLPVQFYIFEEGLFIISAAPKYRDLVGAQVLKFGSSPVNEVIQALDPVISRDNAMWVKQIAPYRMRNLPILYALGLIPDADKVALTLRDINGNERVVTLATDNTQPDIWAKLPNPQEWINLSQTLNKSVPLYLKNPEAFYWFEYMPDSKIVYFQFNIVNNNKEETLAAFTDRLFKFINENEVNKLAIDLRWNNGGNTSRLTPLIQGLIKNEKINQRGKLFVIIGRRTFSAAQNATSLLERQTNAIFVGEPTGSNPNFVGDSSPFKLPYSQIIANVSDVFWQGTTPYDKRIWIPPHIYVPPTFKSYSENRDNALEAIIEYKQNN